MSVETTVLQESHAEESLLGTLGINTVGFVGQLLNFLIIFLALKIWVFPAVMKMLDERSEKIEKGLKDAEAATARLEASEKERETVLAEARGEGKKALEEAHAAAEAQAAAMLEKAKREVERVVVAGKATLKEEQEAMVRDARKEIAEIAVAAAKKILADQVDEKKAYSLAEEAVRKLS